MGKTVLILTQPGDVHAYAVAVALRRRGAVPVLWHTPDFPHDGRESALFTRGEATLSVCGADDAAFDPSAADVVWYRRPAQYVRSDRLHPSDRGYVEEACKQFREGFMRILAPRAFWVNPYGAATAAGRKIHQHSLATAAGFEMPDTLYGNDPAMIRAFIAAHGGRIVFKPFKGLPWSDETGYYMPYTTRLTEEQLIADNMIQAAPGIYQAEVEKAYELRITVMGERVFAVKIHSQDTVHGRIDWRKAYSELRMEPYELPDAVVAKCHDLLNRMNLVFGCIDLIVTPDGEYVFLEVNQMGQFLFLERYAGVPLLDAFAEFLAQGRPDFAWSPERVSIRFPEVFTEVQKLSDDAVLAHVSIPPGAWHDSSTSETTDAARAATIS
jgi:glutathione synthase/RimK-type ligase-like ATP-grasp enzyme